MRELKGHVQSLLETAKGFYFYRLACEPGIPPKTRIVMVSPSITDVMGIKDANDFESWFAGLHPDDVSRIMAAHQKTLETGALFAGAVARARARGPKSQALSACPSTDVRCAWTH